MPSGFTPDAIWVSDLNVRKVDSDPGSTTAIRNTTAGLGRVKAELDALIDQGVTKVGTPADNQVGVWTGSGTIEGDADLTFDGAGAFYVQSTDTGAALGPTLTLHRNSATPAAFDLLGGVNFDGEDSGGNQTTYGRIAADIISPTDTAEKGRLNFYTQDALGTLWLNVQMQIDQVTFLDCDLDLYDHQGAPANGTYLDYLYFSSENSSAGYVRYVTLQAQTDSVAPGVENGSFQVAVMKAGASTVTLEVDSAGVSVPSGALTLATDLAVTEGGTGASTAAAARTNLGVDVASISGHIETAANKTYVLDLKAPYAYVVNSLAARTASGTCTAALAIDGVNVTGISALSVSSTEASATASAANTVGVDTTLALVVSANSTALDLSFTVKITR